MNNNINTNGLSINKKDNSANDDGGSNTCDRGEIDPHQQSEVGADVIDGVVLRAVPGSLLDRH